MDEQERTRRREQRNQRNRERYQAQRDSGFHHWMERQKRASQPVKDTVEQMPKREFVSLKGSGEYYDGQGIFVSRPKFLGKGKTPTWRRSLTFPSIVQTLGVYRG